MDGKNLHSIRSKGFTLIACLLLLVLLTGLSISLMMMVNTESKVGSGDAQNGIAYRAAEGAIEKMSSDIAIAFRQQSPQSSTICNLSNNPPTNLSFVTFPTYQIVPSGGCPGAGPLNGPYGEIQSGANQGLYAEIVPITLTATAQTALGQQVSMTRQSEVALIPVFQFGVFSDSDLSFFAGPKLDFQGRVATNGDLYLSSNPGPSIFHDKVSAYGNIIRDVMPNGLSNATYSHNGTIAILTQPGGCDDPAIVNGALKSVPADDPAVNGPCRFLQMSPTNEGSTLTGSDPSDANQNPNWQTISTNASNATPSGFNHWLIDGDYGSSKYGTGATILSLPFMTGTTTASTPGTGPWPYEIIRRPPVSPAESATSAIGQSRLYNEANIRILLSDDPAELPGGANDADNIRLANIVEPGGDDYTHGIPVTTAAGVTKKTYFAEATTGVPDPTQYDGSTTVLGSDWPFQPVAPTSATNLTLVPNVNTGAAFNAPLVVPASDGSGLTIAPSTALNLSVCNPSTPTTGTAPVCPGTSAYPYYTPTAYPEPASPTKQPSWNLLDGYLRVEYLNAAGNWNAVTREWLGLGFARGTLPPTGGAGTNPVNPNAILVLQEPADRNADGTIDAAGAVPGYNTSTSTSTTTSQGPCIQWKAGKTHIDANCTKFSTITTTTTTTTYTPYPGKPPEVTNDPVTADWRYGDSSAGAALSPTMYNWYPINFYDAREGEIRDVQQDTSCTPMGIMNAVELDVANLKAWLAGTIGTNGPNVDTTPYNGYIVYFSDRRGMLKSPNGTPGVSDPNTKTGDSGFEDSINASVQAGTPDGKLDPVPANKKVSPEDVNENGLLDNFGGGNLGLGFGYIGGNYSATKSVNALINSKGDPWLTTTGRIPDSALTNSCNMGQKNWVSGARHVLRLVDGSLGNLPRPGFTVASENPLYVLGDYNSSAADPMWANPLAAEPSHSAASVIADAVTTLSNSWSDRVSFQHPTNSGSRPATTTYYRMAISAGKNINFPLPAWVAPTAGNSYDFGTDGGLHNFLRLLENWGGQTLNYKGSLVSMYYSTYATGTFKDNTDYSPPSRNYIFDPLFSQEQNLPPGTPMFRDVDSLSYRQSFASK